MNNKIINVRHSQLCPEAIKEFVLNKYELDEPLSCKLYDSGLNDIYIISANEKVFYLRVSLTAIHTRTDYDEEINIINILSENGINVAKPILCRDGNFIWEINAPEGLRYAILFTEAKNLPSDNKVSGLNNLGVMVAKLHIIADEKKFTVSREPIDLIQLIKKPLDNIQPHLEKRPDDFKYLESSAEKLGVYINENLSKEKPYYGYCHGDIHSGNVFFEGENPKLFDFDCMGYGWRAYDICVYLWNKTFGEEKYIESKEWQAYLDGYNSIRQLDEIELKSINAFTALRELWLMGLHADVIERNAGCSWYNNGYFDYRIGNFKLWYERFMKESQ
jgi:Ser/Thr protein kinase RdoA (MazF antagonist)